MKIKKGFEIPKIEEVKNYIGSKRPEWPNNFTDYYANRFWNYYQSNGWLVSGRAKMNDWKAAFCSQWNFLKFREDLDMLSKCQVEPPRMQVVRTRTQEIPPTENRTVDYMNEVLSDYHKHPTLVSKERLASCYDWLKQSKLIQLTKEQREIVINLSLEDVYSAKAAAVQYLFDWMALNFKNFIKEPQLNLQHVG